MPKYYGCPCEACGEPLTLAGRYRGLPGLRRALPPAPVTRRLGRCAHSRRPRCRATSGTSPTATPTCAPAPACGEQHPAQPRTRCRCCGAAAAAGRGVNEPADRDDRATTRAILIITALYRQFEESDRPSLNDRRIRPPLAKRRRWTASPARIGPAFIGPAAPSYLAHLQPDGADPQQGVHELFGFAVRAFLFLLPQGMEARIRLPRGGAAARPSPTFIEMLQVSGSSHGPRAGATARCWCLPGCALS